MKKESKKMNDKKLELTSSEICYLSILLDNKIEEKENLLKEGNLTEFERKDIEELLDENYQLSKKLMKMHEAFFKKDKDIEMGE